MNNQTVRDIAMVAPSERQIKWQEMEFYGFAHFGINTFTGSEWGMGNEDPKLFNPTQLNADQWVEACKSAGMTGLLLTCKHHDGFCLWPSKYTEHSVKNSPWKNGKGDVVKEVSDACRKGGIKFGVYLSPWDRHERVYGDSPKYNEYFLNQLTELLTNYGEIFCVWFDGACGEGPNGKRQVYDWESYYALIRKLQPNAVISICGPDVRWCGNEAGHCRESEWSVVPASLRDNEKISEESQKADDGEFAQKINSQDADLGSREAISKVKELIWYPAEVDTSIRPGWFYHEEEDDKVKSLEKLLHIYYGSVGGNACLLLNLPPDKRGLIHENDAKRLKELGDYIKENFTNNILEGASVIASEESEQNIAVQAIDNDKDTFWSPKEGTQEAYIEFELPQIKTFDKAILMENIKNGQRIEAFKIEYLKDNEWINIYNGTVVGYKRICIFEQISTKKVRITITKSRWCPEIKFVGLY